MSGEAAVTQIKIDSLEFMNTQEAPKTTPVYHKKSL